MSKFVKFSLAACLALAVILPNMAEARGRHGGRHGHRGHSMHHGHHGHFCTPNERSNGMCRI